MRHPSPNTTAKQTLSIIVNPLTYQRLHQEIGKGKISRFVEELIIRELSGNDNGLEKKQKEFQKKLIRGYQAMTENKKLKEELTIWEEVLDSGDK